MKRSSVFVSGLLLLLPVIFSATLFGQNLNCSIIVPDNPLSAQGLATPYQLFAPDATTNGPCNETNPGQSAFVQAAIFDPATGQISIYAPLVIDQGTEPAIAPTAPTLPAHAIVAIWFGFNGNNLTQTASSPAVLRGARCVNGLPGNVFSQFSYCNAPAFFAAANRAIRDGRLKVPELGRGADGLTCPTVRDFFVVDQDQSDNLPVQYLMATDGSLAQNTPANSSALPGSVLFGNPSDNGLLDRFIDKALSCTPWKVTDLADQSSSPQQLPGLALNELQARSRQSHPSALVPAGDPMTRDNDITSPNVGTGPVDLAKLNAYRRGVDQAEVPALWEADTGRYCRNMLRIAPPRLVRDQALLAAIDTPVAAIGNNLFTFMAARFIASYNLLNCGSFVPIGNPITVKTDDTGAAISAIIDVPAYGRCMRYVDSWRDWDRAADEAESKRQ